MPEAKDPKDPDKEKAKKDLDKLSTNPTGIFRKEDFDKMLGEYANKKSDDIIDELYDELTKKKQEKK
ncbi:MAG: hypothetical protein KDC45_13890 [Bacteroidetes bacterium]|nr:hypothetical protein [Bacteroidota bacterium]